jgi:hypothetical protein
MIVLRGVTQNFSVRGRHPTLFRVPLPLISPVEVLQPMVDRFRHHTCDELMARYQSNSNNPADTKKKHKHSPSFQSNDGFDHSDNSGKIIEPGGIFGELEQDDSHVQVPVLTEGNRESGSDDSDIEDSDEGVLHFPLEASEDYDGDRDDSGDDRDDTSDYCIRLPVQ